MANDITAATPKLNSPQRILPPIEHEGLRISALLTRDHNLSLLLEIQSPPGVLSIMYPVESYTKIAEFRAMLAHPLIGKPGDDWDGNYFYAFAGGTGPDRYYWRGHGHGITICVAAAQWTHMRELFEAAFAVPDYSNVWIRLTAQYGGR